MFKFLLRKALSPNTLFSGATKTAALSLQSHESTQLQVNLPTVQHATEQKLPPVS